MASVPHSDSTSTSGYAPFAQLIKMLLPSARSVAIYDTEAELVWCSDGYERPDLRAVLEHQRSSETLAARGSVEMSGSGVPVFVAGLRETLYRDAVSVATRALQILPWSHGDRSGMIGCASMALDQVLSVRAVDRMVAERGR